MTSEQTPKAVPQLMLNGEPLRICVDIDGVLAEIDHKIPYPQRKPIEKNIVALKKLANLGAHIILYSARRMRTHKGNVAAVIQETSQETFQWLARYFVPFAEIHFGKPYAQCYIDDLAPGYTPNLLSEIADNLQLRVAAELAKKSSPRPAFEPIEPIPAVDTPLTEKLDSSSKSANSGRPSRQLSNRKTKGKR